MRKTSKKQRIIGLILAISILLNIIIPLNIAVKANDSVELEEITNFKDNWLYKPAVTEHTVEDALTNTSNWTSNALPIGYASSSAPLVEPYISANNGTFLAQPSSTAPSLRRNMVLQKTINITDLNDYKGFVMDAVLDDGAVIFINGEVTFTFNAVKMNNANPTSATGIRLFDYERRYTIEDPLNYTQRMKTTYENYFISKDAFVEGENKIVVALLQDSDTSSDIFFDAMLYAVPEDFEDITPTSETIGFGDDWLWIKNYTVSYLAGNSWWMSEDFSTGGVEEQTSSFRSNGWKVGKMPIGYSTTSNFASYDAPNTLLTYNTSNNKVEPQPSTGSVQDTAVSSLNLRHVIDIEDVSKIANADAGMLTMQVNYNRYLDVYVNGERVGGTTSSSSTINSMNINVPVEKLNNGKNIICVELRTLNPDNTSLYFDMNFPIVCDEETTPENSELIEIPNFREDWVYKTAVTDNAVESLNTSTWATGKLPMGFASSGTGIRTYIANNSGTLITQPSGNERRNLVLQKKVNIANVDLYSGFVMDAMIDDGAVIFVNGTEALRLNTYHTGNNSTSQSGGTRLFGYERRYVIQDPFDQPNKSHYEKFVIDKSLFKNGDNIITVALLQHTNDSSDIFFDGMLYTMPDDFKDIITPSGDSLDYGDEWLWIKNECESTWLSKDFIPVGVKNPDSYVSSNHTMKNPIGWRINSSSFGYDNNNSTGQTITTRIPHNTASKESDPVDNDNPTNLNMSTNNVYLRRYLDISDISQLKNANGEPIQNIIIKITRIRNVAVYVNGEMVKRTTNGSDGQVHYNVIEVPISKFNNLRNIISVDLINTTPGSSSIYFDMKVILDEDDNDLDEPLVFDGENFIMSPGKDETEINFLWHIPYVLGTNIGANVQYEKSSIYNSDGFNESNIVYGTTAVTYDNKQANRAVLTGLEPDTEYTYRYGNAGEDNWSDIHTFKTGNKEYKAIYISDPQIGASGNQVTDGVAWNNTMNNAVSQIPDARFIVSGGDNVDNYTNGSESQYVQLKAADAIKNLPYAPSNGNHDADASNYLNHYNRPNVTENGVTDGGSNYYFSYGNTLYIMLNSGNYTGNGNNVAEHVQTLNKAIESYPDAKWRVVVMHFDVYGAGGHATGRDQNYYSRILNLRNNLTPYFDQMGIDIVLNGHDHVYSRSHFMKGNKPQLEQNISSDGAVVNPNGIVYIAASTASGSKYYDIAANQTWLAVRSEIRQPQFTELAVTNTEFRITTYRSDTLAVIDEIVLRKEAYTKEHLLNKIEEAKEFMESVSVGDELGQVPQPAKDTLNAAIVAAEKVFSDNDASEQEITDAIVALTVSVSNFKAVIISSENPVPENPNPGDTNTETPEIGNPETADERVIIYLLLSSASLILMGGMLLRRRKVRRDTRN